jgi:hypothetical protein
MTKLYDNAKRGSLVRRRVTTDGMHETNVNTLAARAVRFTTNCIKAHAGVPLRLRAQRRLYYDPLI